MKSHDVFGLARPEGPLNYELPVARYATDESALLVSIGDILDAASADAMDLATHFRVTKPVNDRSEAEIEQVLEAFGNGAGITFEEVTEAETIVDQYMERLNPDEMRNFAKQLILQYAANNLAYPQGRLHRDALSSLPGKRVALIATSGTEMRITQGADVIDEREVKEGDIVKGFIRNALDLAPITLTQSLQYPDLGSGQHYARPGDLRIETLATQGTRLPFGISGPSAATREVIQLQAINPTTYQPLLTDSF